MKNLRAIHFLDPDYTKKIKEALKSYEFNLDRNPLWHLYGDLVEMVGTDQATIINLKDFPKLTGETIKWGNIRNNRTYVDKFIDSKEIKATGIFPITIDGIKEECVGYFWVENEQNVAAYDHSLKYKLFKTWEQRGLVCLVSDVEACKEAEKMYNKYK